MVSALVVVGLITLYFLLDQLVETPRKQISRKLREMAAAVKTGSVDRIFAHISPSFKFQGQDKAAFRAFCERVFRDGLAEELVIWDINFPDRPDRAHFRATLKSRRLAEFNQFIVQATFAQDDDGQWRMRGFELFNPLVDAHAPIPVPANP